MNRVIDYVIEGNVTDGNRIDFVKDKLAVHAVVNDRELAHAAVDDKGHYKLSFACEEELPPTQIRVTPAAFTTSLATLALSDTFAPSRYVVKGNTATARHDFQIPSDYVDIMKPLTTTYHFHGELYAATYDDGELQYIEALPAMKIDFFLQVPPKPPIGEIGPKFPPPKVLPKRPTRIHLGTAFSSPDPAGSYVFDFKLPILKKPFKPLGIKPVVTASISQLVYGTWQKIYQDDIDWQLETDLHKDFFVPAGNLKATPPIGVHPIQTGFLFEHVGLLPIDNLRIKNGYASTLTGDLGGLVLKDEPFCATLWIYGLFAVAPSPVAYKVQVKFSQDNLTWGPWEDVTDPLYNSYWDNTTHTWKNVYLGPIPVDPQLPPNSYRNIDNDPLIWNTPALKFHWNSNTPKGDGCYVLRVIPYDANGNQIIRYDAQGHALDAEGFSMPMIRVCNSRPEVSLTATNPLPTECGILQSTQNITFLVKAADTEGMGWYELGGTRGRDGLTAGSKTYNPPEVAPTLPAKDLNFNVDFAVAPLNNLSNCPAVAYHFLLTVQGLGTDGNSNSFEIRRNYANSNLIIMK